MMKEDLINNVVSEYDDEEEIESNGVENILENYVETLPKDFNSLIDQPIELLDKSPRGVIELLGNVLGISNFQTNMASFWFLDILSLQVLKYESKHDHHYRSVFVSWLAGEFQFIRKRNPTRQQFFNEMVDLFCTAMTDINLNKPLLHWEKVFSEIPNGSSIITEEKSRLTRQSFNEICFQRLSKSPSNEYESPKSSSSFNINEVLNTIVEATFDIFGSEFQYLLIQEAFVNKIEQLHYVLPYTLCEPRKIKEAALTDNFDTVLKQKLNDEILNQMDNKNKSSRKSKTSLSSVKLNVGVSPPPSSLVDEEVELKERKYILPLSESLEANEKRDIIM